MSMGTYRPTWLHRLGDAYLAYKGIPPAALYPVRQGVQSGYLTFPGWDYLEKETRENRKDEQRVKVAVTSPWVYADVQLIANLFSTSSLIVKERVGDKLEDVD